jgi:PPM family protein phosphatase
MTQGYNSFGLTDIGKMREENQDDFHIDQEHGLFIVADGMGGLQESTLAAKYVTKGFSKLLQRKLKSQPKKKAENITLAIRQIVDKLSSSLRERQGKNTGATLVSILIDGEYAYVTNLGDSRAYLLRNGILQRLTTDHNVAALLVDMNKITQEEARTHPMRHRLTAYVGMEGKVTPEVKQITLRVFDRLLLCTDGLTGMLPENEIQKVLNEEKNQKLSLEKLIAQANAAGGYDNITAILIDIIEEQKIKPV